MPRNSWRNSLNTMDFRSCLQNSVLPLLNPIFPILLSWKILLLLLLRLLLMSMMLELMFKLRLMMIMVIFWVLENMWDHTKYVSYSISNQKRVTNFRTNTLDHLTLFFYHPFFSSPSILTNFSFMIAKLNIFPGNWWETSEKAQNNFFKSKWFRN